MKCIYCGKHMDEEFQGLCSDECEKALKAEENEYYEHMEEYRRHGPNLPQEARGKRKEKEG